MRRQRTLLVLLLAIASGGLAGYSALKLLSERAQPLAAVEAPRTSTQVVVAARDLSVGTLIGEEDVKLVEWPSSTVPDGYARSIPEVVGRGLIAQTRLNEPLLNSKMADRSGQGGLQIVIPEGMRAVAVRVDELIAVAGFVIPGARVDLYLTTTPPGGGDQVTKIVMQNVTVLTAGQQIQSDPEGRPITVGLLTVVVTPEDGEKLIHASKQGTIQLGLRNMLDIKETRTPGARLSTLFAGAGSPPRTAGGTTTRRPAPATSEGQVQSSVVEVYKGGVKALIRF